jgi:hypothetical protein
VSTRDDLAAVIGTSVHAGNHIRFDITGDRAWFDDSMPRDLADAILAAGWRPPTRTVGTVEELTTVPVGAILRSARTNNVWWRSTNKPRLRWIGSDGLYSFDDDFIRLEGPLTVLFEGGVTAHPFLPVNGHPDDDECTYREDGTDATYCGEPRAAHEGGA